MVLSGSAVGSAATRRSTRVLEFFRSCSRRRLAAMSELASEPAPAAAVTPAGSTPTRTMRPVLALDVLKLVAQSLIDEVVESAFCPFPSSRAAQKPGKSGGSVRDLLAAARGALWAMTLTSRAWAAAALPAQFSLLDLPRELALVQRYDLSAVRVLLVASCQSHLTRSEYDRVLATLSASIGLRTILSTTTHWSSQQWAACTALILFNPPTSGIGHALSLVPKLRALRVLYTRAIPAEPQPMTLRVSSALVSLAVVSPGTNVANVVISMALRNLEYLKIHASPVERMPTLFSALSTLRHLELHYFHYTLSLDCQAEQVRYTSALVRFDTEAAARRARRCPASAPQLLGRLRHAP